MNLRNPIALLLCLAVAETTSIAGTIHTFTGPWAPTPANGFNNATGGPGTFTTSVSPDGLVLTANIANNGETPSSSFFLENYSFINPLIPDLPVGPVSFDYKITLTSPTGFVREFDDFGHNAFYASGTEITGTYSINYAGGYFGYFGVNIDDFGGTASAVITLSNFSAPVPDQGSTLLFATALTGILIPALRRRTAAATAMSR